MSAQPAKRWGGRPRTPGLSLKSPPATGSREFRRLGRGEPGHSGANSLSRASAPATSISPTAWISQNSSWVSRLAGSEGNERAEGLELDRAVVAVDLEVAAEIGVDGTAGGIEAEHDQ